MRKWRHVYLDMWGENVYFIKCSALMYKKALKDEFNCELTESIKFTDQARFKIYIDPADGTPLYIIWVREWTSLAHELVHCVCAILKDKGLWLDDCSEEAYAYLIGYLDTQFRKG